MDGFTPASEELFKAQTFGDAPSTHELLEVTQDTLEGHAHTLHVSSTELQNTSQSTEILSGQGSIQNPTIILVKLEYEPKVTPRFHARAADVAHLFRSFQLQPYMLYLVSRDVVGFQQVAPSTRASAAMNQSSLSTYYLNYEAMKIIWSYDPQTRNSSGVIFARVTPGGRAAFSQYRSNLRSFCHGEMVYHPLFLLFVAIVSNTQFYDQRVIARERSISTTELKTPYSPWSLDVSVNLMGVKKVNKISLYSSKMAAAVLDLEDVLQHFRMVKNMKSAFDEADPLAPGRESIMEGLELILPRLEYTIIYAEYLRERAKNQLAVMLNLIARGDTLATIDLGRATKADGFSMKVIAIMTMAFLPATAVATLLSLPLFKWDDARVVTGSFGIYWAISIPITLAIFFVWWVSTVGWSEFIKRLRRKPAKKLEGLEDDDTEAESDLDDDRISYTHRSSVEV